MNVTGMNLIDCEKKVIVKAAQGMRWLALSYVWGTNSETEDRTGFVQAQAYHWIYLRQFEML
jgi:hypothetical protein